jgi:hypothetical protein
MHVRLLTHLYGQTVGNVGITGAEKDTVAANACQHKPLAPTLAGTLNRIIASDPTSLGRLYRKPLKQGRYVVQALSCDGCPAKPFVPPQVLDSEADPLAVIMVISMVLVAGVMSVWDMRTSTKVALGGTKISQTAVLLPIQSMMHASFALGDTDVVATSCLLKMYACSPIAAVPRMLLEPSTATTAASERPSDSAALAALMPMMRARKTPGDSRSKNPANGGPLEATAAEDAFRTALNSAQR